jgi:hypothetical protein
MTPNTTRCRVCDGEMTLQDIDRIEGAEHGVHLCIQHMPTMACAQGHRRFVAPAFASAMLDALLSGSADRPFVPLDAAGRRGLLRKRYTCPGCDAVLDDGTSGRVETQRVVEIDGLHPFEVQVDLPTYRCGACKTESVEPRDAVVDDLMKASVNAFRSAQLTAH